MGCGTGYFVAVARGVSYHVSGIDLSDGQLEVARRRFGLTEVQALMLDEYPSTVRAPGCRVDTLALAHR